MKDWKGNKIEVGHTVLVISTGSMFEGSAFVIRYGDKEIKSEPIKKSYQFEISCKYKITEPSNTLALSLGNEQSEMPINHVDFFIAKQPYQIICIKGVSDNKEKYYIDYFNN